ncbi:MAG: HTTM domain-containing protein [Sandaracinaceae bacterium]
MTPALEKLRAALGAPRDAASLAAFRVLLGAVMVVSVARYFAYGWIDAFYVRPIFTFQYWGFGWVRPLPEPYLTAVFAVLLVAAVCVTLGLFYRVATITFFALFSYVALLDVTRYLNHYYLVILLSGILCVLPLHACWSLDALRDRAIRRATLPAWMLYWLRFQVGVVYVFAGLAKVGPDWLVDAQPLGIWLSSRTEAPLLGSLFGLPFVPVLMAWAGCLYDLTIPFWLSREKTRPYAFAVLCAFHLTTHLLFDIGIFPILMTVAATVFFDPSWPRRLADRIRRLVGRAPSAEPDRPAAEARMLPRWGLALLGLYALVQLVVPLRSHLYSGDVLWHEQGMRWSWRVMLHEKNGRVEYRVRRGPTEREVRVSPRRYLTEDQEREFGAQPDLILQLAHHIAERERAAGHPDVEVRVDAWASLNGRRSARLIDPSVDLAKVDDSVLPAQWILPLPHGRPAGSGHRYAELF